MKIFHQSSQTTLKCFGFYVKFHDELEYSGLHIPISKTCLNQGVMQFSIFVYPFKFNISTIYLVWLICPGVEKDIF